MRFSVGLVKEFRDGTRNYRFLIIGLALLFFGLLNPVLQKYVVPEIMQWQYPLMADDARAALLITAQTDIIKGYLSDAAVIGMLVVLMALTGLMAGELKNRTLILPVAAGKRYRTLILAKFTVYGTALMLAANAATLINYAMSGLLFGFELATPLLAIRSGSLFGLYLIFAFSLVLFLGTIIRHPTAAALTAFLSVILLTSGAEVTGLHLWTPMGLLNLAVNIQEPLGWTFGKTVIISLGLIAVVLRGTTLRLQKTELAR